MEELRINELPIRTWNFLDVNDVRKEIANEYVKVNYEIDNKELDYENMGIDLQVDEIKYASWIDELEIGCGEKIKRVLKDSNIPFDVFRVKEKKIQEPLKINLNYEDSIKGLLSRTIFELDKDSSLVVIRKHSGQCKKAIEDVRFNISENSMLTIVEIFDFDNDSDFVGSISGEVSANAEFKLMQVCMGSGKITIGSCINLKGNGSKLNVDSGYLLKDDDELDIKYIARHRGRYSNSKINVSGVLRDKAKKSFAGTIDFIKGSKHAMGDEREDVLLMDEGVFNNTTPIILCEEEDVEGAHGASIGKISDEAIFYFKTRGVSEEEINEIMAKSRLEAVISRIPDEKTRDELLTEE